VLLDEAKTTTYILNENSLEEKNSKEKIDNDVKQLLSNMI
jgi:hypothetical protein